VEAQGRGSDTPGGRGGGNPGGRRCKSKKSAAVVETKWDVGEDSGLVGKRQFPGADMSGRSFYARRDLTGSSASDGHKSDARFDKQHPSAF
jgi:hypothetical protein